MSREIDLRDARTSRATAQREGELRARASAVSARLPGGHRVRVAGLDATTGNATAIRSEGAPALAGSYLERALEHLRNIGGPLGLAPSQPAEFAADPNVQRTSSGAVAVHLQQRYRSVPIFEAAQTVRFAPDGALEEAVGRAVTVEGEVEVRPPLAVEAAVRRAAEHVASPQPDEEGARDSFGEPLALPRLDVSQFEPRVVATFPELAERATVLDAGPFGDRIKASLTWFPLGEQLRLAWEIVLTLPAAAGQYRTLVDAETGKVLYCRQLIQSVLARGNVYRRDGGEPRQMTDFPRPLADHGLPLPADLPPGFPEDWVTDNRTAGNSVEAHLGANGPTMLASAQNGRVTFDPANATGDEQKILNIFYYNCMMHDFFYLAGFREEDGNFQQDNRGRGGFASDRVDARAHSGAVLGTANMRTPIDGSRPEMNMGLVTSTGRHTAFDASVVYHEFMHGVTNRLVGGPQNVNALNEPQSGGMGEGWGDYIACTLNGNAVVGSWVVDKPGGIRGFPYDENFPDSFGDLGTGRYNEVHNIGEIWCATLVAMNRRIGATLGVQLVVDALKLSPANPSFLDMRDAILAALDHKLAGGQLDTAAHAAASDGIWGAFAKFGMGPGARSNGARLAGIVADFTVPAGGGRVRVEATPNLPIPDREPAGVMSTLAVAQAGRIARLTLAVDIEHPYIGDLRLALHSPAGTAATVHDRTGASADDLRRAYSTDDTLELAALVGEQAAGEWTLEVADLAAEDVGRLHAWSLEIALESASPLVRGEARPGVQIPDANPAGVSSPISIAQAGTARSVKVEVDITHTYVGDLRVELVAPSGRQAILHSRSGGTQDNLITAYDSTATPDLAALVGSPIEGTWLLRVTDLAGLDVGKLNRWSLEIGMS